jgi:cystathionine gamma-synthase
MRLETTAVHAGAEVDAVTGAVASPLHLSTTFKHGPAGERAAAGFEYIREGNPNEQRLEVALAALEQGSAALVFASGMAAINALLMSLPPGSNLIIPRDVYAGTRTLAREFLPALGIAAIEVDTMDIDAVRAAVTAGTRCVWIETPSNPLLNVSDIAAIAAIAHEAGALMVVDNTFATPVLQQPLSLGADVVMHSTTKYCGGHSDVLGGALVFRERGALHEAIAHARHVQGAVMAPFNAWLTLRGLRGTAAMRAQ